MRNYYYWCYPPYRIIPSVWDSVIPLRSNSCHLVITLCPIGLLTSSSSQSSSPDWVSSMGPWRKKGYSPIVYLAPSWFSFCPCDFEVHRSPGGLSGSELLQLFLRPGSSRPVYGLSLRGSPYILALTLCLDHSFQALFAQVWGALR